MKIFNIGNYRRAMLGNFHDATWFDQSNTEAVAARKRCTDAALDDLVSWLKLANDGRVAARLRELRELLGPERVRALLAGGGGVGSGEKYASTGAAIVGAGVGLAALGPLTAVALAAGAGAAAHAAVGRGAAPPAETEAAADAEAPTGGYFSGGAAAAAAAAALIASGSSHIVSRVSLL